MKAMGYDVETLASRAGPRNNSITRTLGDNSHRGNQTAAKTATVPPFLSLHGLAAARGDGLHPELLVLFKRLATGADSDLLELLHRADEFTGH